MKSIFCKLGTGITILFIFLCIIPASAMSMDYDHEIKLEKMTFSWKIQEQLLYVKLTAATTGWVGIGFNPSTKMQDANFVLGYVKNGTVIMTDAYGVRPKEHIDDTAMNGQNNVVSVSGSEQGEFTTIEFSLPLDSGDAADRKINREGVNTVLLAFGKGQDNFQSRHRFRTSLQVDLSNGKYH
ncbi:MAG: DOMON domain-containing protein [bacterium]